jgi:hypothetical protein
VSDKTASSQLVQQAQRHIAGGNIFVLGVSLVATLCGILLILLTAYVIRKAWRSSTREITPMSDVEMESDEEEEGIE